MTVVKIPDDGPIEAPARLCLWRPGPFVGDFGECVWDEEAARAVMAAYEERGNPIPIDVEHNSNLDENPGYDPSDPPEGGGYLWLRLAEDGSLWLDPIQWSDYARRQIESGSRRSVSPDWVFDPKTKRPLRLRKVSLVQNPGTYGIGLIASARQAPACNARGSAMDPKMVAAVIAGLLALAENADEATKTKATELATNLQELAANLGLELPPPESAGPGAGEQEIAGEDEQEVAGEEKDQQLEKVMAQAAALLASARTKPQQIQRGRAASPRVASVTQREVDAMVERKLAEHGQKQALIAGAKDRPGMTPDLAVYLASRPLAEVREIVARLPRPAGAPSAVAGASGRGGVRQGPLGTTPGLDGSSREAERIRRINEAGATRQEIVEAAAAGAKEGPDGTVSFSAIGQMKR